LAGYSGTIVDLSRKLREPLNKLCFERARLAGQGFSPDCRKLNQISRSFSP
jgi:hypothetical protein